MKTATVRQFRDHATSLLKQEEPILVTRHGKIIGFFLPAGGESLPLEIKRELFATLAGEIRATLRARELTEETLLADFKKTRRPRRRR